jgi:LysR family hydrogen peroxide-inducible transcriptional activator
MNLPTLRQLRYLVTLMETRHFGRAAKLCLVTQPTLSSGIQELEALLGVKLFERNKRTVIPTKIGLEMSERAQLVIQQVEDMLELSHKVTAPLTGSLRLGAIPTIGPFLLPKVLPHLREQYPNLKLYLREDQTARLLEQLSAGTLDVLILALPYDLDGARSIIVGDDPFYVALPKDHPLTTKKIMRHDDIPEEEILLLEEGHCLREHALAACSLKGSNGQNDVKGTSLYTLVQMVASGLGVTLVPAMARSSDILKSADVVTIPMEASATPRQIGLVWRRTSSRDREFQLLADLISSTW